MFRSASGSRRWLFLFFALLLSLIFVLPKQSRDVLHLLGKPAAELVSLPVGLFASLDRAVKDTWEGYIALRHAHEENRKLRREIVYLRGQNEELRETAASAERLAALLAFKERTPPETLAAQVIGRDASNWYRGVILNKGERDGIRPDMGVMTPAGAVGRVIKTSASTSVVLLITDPNNAITGLVQRTRDEGIIEGTTQGRARLKYLPLLSTVHAGDVVVTSGLTGGFPRGVVVGVIRNIERREGDLFQRAEIDPEVDFSKLEEVLVITVPRALEPEPPPPEPKPSRPSSPSP
jgi:rod shape-determining protein MreC